MRSYASTGQSISTRSIKSISGRSNTGSTAVSSIRSFCTDITNSIETFLKSLMSTSTSTPARSIPDEPLTTLDSIESAPATHPRDRRGSASGSSLYPAQENPSMHANVGDSIDRTRTALQKALKKEMGEVRTKKPTRITRQVAPSALHRMAEVGKSTGMDQYRRGHPASDLLKGGRNSIRGP